MKNYQRTKIACYMGLITQAIAANFAPLLFLKFHNDYDIPLGDIALISTFYFFTQIFVDLFCSKYVDKLGYRKCIIASEVLSCVGLISLAFLPDLLPSAFLGIIISVIIYAIGCGLIEVLCSPIIEACPFENKEATMSLLHSFYCWGCVATILLSTIFFTIFGIDKWRYLAVIFALVPMINIYNFSTCPIEYLASEEDSMGVKELLKKPLFWTCIILMVCAGACELSMAQWASAYVESALGLSKSIGDLAGPCMFAVTMGISRVMYGKSGERIDLMMFMKYSGVLCLLCYALSAFSSSALMGLVGCIFCGFSVGIMWPGTISISSKTFPKGSTAMFALLAMAGDLGGSIGPAIVGTMTQWANDNIQIGMAVGLIFPIVLLVMIYLIKKTVEDNEISEMN